ncbi:MAG: hypothetical protein JOZ41_00105 [Chloroflexi bacterium]|nr:hypothetical protein [Chloroflexota bacterium]
MQQTRTTSAWIDQIRADIAQVEWDWRSLDEQDWRSRMPDGQGPNALAKREREREAGRLRAELTVASFLDAFHTGTQSELARDLAARLRPGSWTDATMNRAGFAMILQAEAERAALPDAEIRWGPATATHDASPDDWRVDVEARYLWHGEELSRYRYHFRVVGDRVEGWRATAEAGHVGRARGSNCGAAARHPRRLRAVVESVLRA